MEDGRCFKGTDFLTMSKQAERKFEPFVWTKNSKIIFKKKLTVYESKGRTFLGD